MIGRDGLPVIARVGGQVGRRLPHGFQAPKPPPLETRRPGRPRPLPKPTSKLKGILR